VSAEVFKGSTRTWYQSNVRIPKPGETHHGREVLRVYTPEHGSEPIVYFLTDKTEGACTLARWQDWIDTADELWTDWKYFFKNREERKRRK
jgi:hypothetical protein